MGTSHTHTSADKNLLALLANVPSLQCKKSLHRFSLLLGKVISWSIVPYTGWLIPSSFALLLIFLISSSGWLFRSSVPFPRPVPETSGQTWGLSQSSLISRRRRSPTKLVFCLLAGNTEPTTVFPIGAGVSGYCGAYGCLGAVWCWVQEVL